MLSSIADDNKVDLVEIFSMASFSLSPINFGAKRVHPLLVTRHNQNIIITVCSSQENHAQNLEDQKVHLTAELDATQGALDELHEEHGDDDHEDEHHDKHHEDHHHPTAPAVRSIDTSK